MNNTESDIMLSSLAKISSSDDIQQLRTREPQPSELTGFQIMFSSDDSEMSQDIDNIKLQSIKAGSLANDILSAIDKLTAKLDARKSDLENRRPIRIESETIVPKSSKMGVSDSDGITDCPASAEDPTTEIIRIAAIPESSSSSLVQEYHDELPTMIEDLKSVRSNVLKAQNNIDEIKKVSNDLVQKLRRFKQSLERKIEKLNETIDQHEEKFQAYKNIIEDMTIHIESLKEDNEHLHVEISELRAKVSRMEDSLTWANTDYAMLCLRQLPGQVMALMCKKCMPAWFDDTHMYTYESILDKMEYEYTHREISESEYKTKQNKFNNMLDDIGWTERLAKKFKYMKLTKTANKVAHPDPCQTNYTVQECIHLLSSEGKLDRMEIALCEKFEEMLVKLQNMI